MKNCYLIVFLLKIDGHIKLNLIIQYAFKMELDTLVLAQMNIS